MKTWNALEEEEEDAIDTWTAFRGGVAAWLQGRKRSSGAVSRKESVVSEKKSSTLSEGGTNNGLAKPKVG